MKVARLYLRVSTDEQDLTRQIDIEHSTRAAGYYVAGIYREKASGTRADRPELLRMIADLQPGEVVVAEKIDRITRLPLAEAEQLVASIRAKGARLAVPGLVDLSDLVDEANGVARIVLVSVQELLLKLGLTDGSGRLQDAARWPNHQAHCRVGRVQHQPSQANMGASPSQVLLNGRYTFRSAGQIIDLDAIVAGLNLG